MSKIHKFKNKQPNENDKVLWIHDTEILLTDFYSGGFYYDNDPILDPDYWAYPPNEKDYNE